MSSISELLEQIRRDSGRQLVITGPATIGGRAQVQGSKNAANKLVAAAVALPGRYTIHNFPYILDPLELLGIAEMLGARVSAADDNTVSIDTTGVHNRPIPRALTISTTSSFGLAGALLGRFGSVQIGKPGGDKIGARPVGLHLQGFRALGAEVSETDTEISAQLPAIASGAGYQLAIRSTGAAVNFVLAVAAARGRAILHNPPSRADGDMNNLYQLLQAAGVKIELTGNRLLIDASRSRPLTSTVSFTCAPDRNDAFTWLAYGAVSRPGLEVSGIDLKEMEPGLQILKRLGVHIRASGSDAVEVAAPPASHHIPDNFTVAAGLAGEFHSDWAPLLEVALATMPGRARIIDTLFSHRVRQAECLEQMGARVAISGGPPPPGVNLHFPGDSRQARYIVDIEGPARLQAITAGIGYDVRACAAIIMAAGLAHGTSLLSDVAALYRGYENVVPRLSAVGLNIEPG